MSSPLWRSNWLYKIIKAIGRFFFNIFYALQIEGQEKIPAQGPAIILPKHQFWTDIPLVALSIPKPLNYIAKKELFIYPLVRHFLIAMGGIPLDRLHPIKSLNSFRYIEKLLRAKEFIVLFPEGTYYPYAVGHGKHRLIQRLLFLQEKMRRQGIKRIPFIPLGINYKRSWWRTKVEIRIGEALYAYKEDESEEFTKTVTKEIACLSRLKEAQNPMTAKKEEYNNEPGRAVGNQR